jgi:hypothetical protein
MNSRLARGLVIVALVFAGIGTAHADVTLVWFRHGEKPDAGLGQLNCQGLNRALALPAVLIGRFGTPDELYAPNPGVTTDDRGKTYNYIRPLATIEPTAIRVGRTVNTRWGLRDLAALEDDLLDPAHDGHLIFVAWEHNLLVQAVRDLVARRGGDAAVVPDWQGSDFDSLYLLVLPTRGKASFRIEHQGLDGQSMLCPGQKP